MSGTHTAVPSLPELPGWRMRKNGAGARKSAGNARISAMSVPGPTSTLLPAGSSQLASTWIAWKTPKPATLTGRNSISTKCDSSSRTPCETRWTVGWNSTAVALASER